MNPKFPSGAFTRYEVESSKTKIYRFAALLFIVSVCTVQTAWSAEQESDEASGKAHSFTTPTSAHAETPPPAAWDHHLPFYGKQLTAKGFHLPDPVGVTIIGTYLEQDLTLDNLQISGDGQNFVPIDFVQFAGADAKDFALEVKIDAWLLPFLNVFAVAGLIDGKGHIPIQLDVGGVLDATGSNICNVPPAIRPAFCEDIVQFDANPNYQGYNYGVGIVLAGGYKSFFVAIPLTAVKSDLNITNSEITSYEAEILFGNSFKLGGGKSVEVFVGASYLDATYLATGFEPLSEINPILPDVYYKIDSSNKDKWNYVVGGQYALSDAWQLQFQVGFGGSRSQYTFAGTFRF